MSIRQALGSLYPDRGPEPAPGGGWIYWYHQENQDPLARDDEFTNKALVRCWRDGVPVGVLRQVQGRPTPRYHVLGLAVVMGWDNGYFVLRSPEPDGPMVASSDLPAAEIAALERQVESELSAAQEFDPSHVPDGRERSIAAIIRRRGQPAFRRQLLEAYGGRCAISGCEVEEVLEACHIVPYKGDQTNVVSNGLLLMADLHVLFDLGLVAVDSETMTVLLSPHIERTVYSGLLGAPLRLPHNGTLHPSRAALDLQRKWSGL